MLGRQEAEEAMGRGLAVPELLQVVQMMYLCMSVAED